MAPIGYLYVFGPLALIVAAGISGHYAMAAHPVLGGALLTASIVGGIAWLFAAWQLLVALNSDI